MYWGGLYLFLLVSSTVSQDAVFSPDPSDLKEEENIHIPDAFTLVRPVEKCLQGEKCKPPAQCALYFTEVSAPTPCLLDVTSSSNTSDIQQGLCCSDVLANRIHTVLPASGEVDDSMFPNTPELDFVSAADLAAGSEESINFLETLSLLENKIKNDESLKIDQLSPEAGHLKVFQSSEKARKIAVRALQLAAATKGLKTRLGLADPDGELRQINVMDTRLGEGCPPLPSCPERLGKYRTHDGSCNNPSRPWIGRAMSPTQRLLHPHYDDGVQVPRLSRDGVDLPGAREISSLLSFDGFRAPQDRKLTALVADFGQFLDHDLSLSPVFRLSGGGGIQCCQQDGSGPQPLHLRHPQCMPIEIPREDPFYARFGQRCMNFVRTMPGLQHNCSLGAIQQLNAVSHWLDGSMIYGSEGGQARTLVGTRGTLLNSGALGDRSLLPSRQGGCTRRRQQENSNFCFRAGDVRVNEQPLLASLSTIFMREHNRIANEIALMHPEYSDDAVYQETRRIVVAELQHITYNEFLPVILGRKFMEVYGLLPLTTTHSGDYNMNYDSSITNEFAAAAYRLHTLVRGDLRFANEFGVNQRMKLRDTLNSPQILPWPEAGDELIRGQASRPLGAFDHIFSEEMTQHLFQTGGGFGLDILSLNIQRGRDHGLPSYNTYRKLCGLPRAKGFQDLIDTVRPEALQVIRRVYRNVEDIDLYVGGISEKRSSGALLGHTFLCLVGDQFARLKKGDRFFYDLVNQPSSFTEAQLNEIRRTSLARILCDNSASVTRIQPLVFWQDEDVRNPIISCDSKLIAKVDLLPWSRELPDTL